MCTSSINLLCTHVYSDESGFDAMEQDQEMRERDKFDASNSSKDCTEVYYHKFVVVSISTQ